MTSPRLNPRRSTTTRFSPILLAAVLTPAFLQVQYTCDRGDSTLALLEVEVSGVDQIDAFDPATLHYDVTVGSDTVLLRAAPQDPAASVFYQLRQGGALLEAGALGVGGGEVTLTLPAVGAFDLKVDVRPPQGGFGFYNVDVVRLPKFDCKEQGILDAIALGGGPHTFDCVGPTTVITPAEIVIDNDVILDGEGRLSIRRSSNLYAERAMAVELGAVAELINMTISGSGGELGPLLRGGAIFNEGTLTLRNSHVVDTVITDACDGAGIYNTGNLWLVGSSVEETSCVYGHGGGIFNSGLAVIEDSDITNTGRLEAGGGIYNTGDVSLIDSRIDLNSGSFVGGIYSVGSLTAARITVSWNFDDTDGGGGVGIYSDGTTLIDSSIISYNSNDIPGASPVLGLYGTAVVANTTVSMNSGGLLGSGTMDLIASTLIIEQGPYLLSPGIEFDGELRARQTIIVDASVQPVPPLCATLIVSEGYNIESPGNTCGFDHPTDLVNVGAAELNLGPLQDNGGPTETHALLPGSVAIDHVPPAMCLDANDDPLGTDQRAVTRPQGSACDVGAFELAN